MHHQFDEVDDDPGVAGVSTRSVRLCSTFLAEVLDRLRYGLHLALARTRPDEDEVADLAESTNIEQDDIVTLLVFQGAGSIDGESTDDLWVCIGTGASHNEPFNSKKTACGPPIVKVMP